MIYRKMHFKRNSNNPTSSPTIKHQDLLKPRRIEVVQRQEQYFVGNGF